MRWLAALLSLGASLRGAAAGAGNDEAGHAHGELTPREQAALRHLRARPDGSACAADEAHATVIGSPEVAVRASLLPGAGRGAFALRPFAKGELVERYFCVVGPMHGSNSDLAWHLNATHMCDARPLPLHNPMRYVNAAAALESCGPWAGDRRGQRPQRSSQPGPKRRAGLKNTMPKFRDPGRVDYYASARRSCATLERAVLEGGGFSPRMLEPSPSTVASVPAARRPKPFASAKSSSRTTVCA